MKYDNKNLFIFSILFLAEVFYVSSSYGFTLNRGSQSQNTIGWKKSELKFDIDTSCASYVTTVEAAISAAANLWSTVPNSDIEISVGDTVTLPNTITTYIGSSATQYAPTGNPIVYCDANFSTTSGSSANSIPGYAGAINMNTDGTIVGGLLVLNVQSNGAASITKLDSTLMYIVLTHEIGHILGIGHSADTNALMYYTTNSSRKLNLAKDDMDAITFLYPRKEPGAGGLMGCNTVRDISNSKKQNDLIELKLPSNRTNGNSFFVHNKGLLEFTLLFLLIYLSTQRKKRTV